MVTRVALAATAHTQLVGFDDEWADAFGRLRVSNPTTLFESAFTYDLQPLIYESVGNAAHDADLRSAVLTGTAALQTRQYWPYEKGKSQLVKVTFVMGEPVAGVTRRAGYYDANDGFFLEQTGDGVAIVRRSTTGGSVVETRVPQAEWNIDKLDGTGESEIALDLQYAQILVIDGQWLGVGRVRVGLNIDGITYYVHEFLHANREPVAPYTRTFTLPVRYEQIDAAGTSTMQCICADVESEGGVDSPIGYHFAGSNDADVATSVEPAVVLSMRPAVDFPDNGATNRSFIIPGDISFLVGGQPCLIEVQYDATLGGGTWTRANPNSAVEVGVGQTLTEPGLVVDSVFVAAGSGNARAASGDSVTSQYPLTLDMDGLNPKALTVVASTLSGTGTVRAAGGWREIR